MNERLRIPIIVLVVLLIGAGAGLKFAGKGGPAVKEPVPTIDFTDPFLANLADSGGNAYVSMKVAVKLAPMTAADLAMFDKGPGKKEGAADSYGAERVGTDPVLRDAVLRAINKFTASELLTLEGKDKLKQQILANFQQVAKSEATPKSKSKDHMPFEPPYSITDVVFPDITIQPAE